MVAATAFLIGLMLLITQLMVKGASGEWPSITIASELGLSADRAYTDWMVVNVALRFLASEVQLWLVLMFAAAVIYWLGDFANEKFARVFSRRGVGGPSALSQEATSEATPLADHGTQA